MTTTENYLPRALNTYIPSRRIFTKKVRNENFFLRTRSANRLIITEIVIIRIMKLYIFCKWFLASTLDAPK